MECYCCLRNVQDLLEDGKTPYEKRFGEPFKVPIIPFGAMVEYFPISSKDQSRLHQFGNIVLPGIFLGYALVAEESGREIFLVADNEELGKLDVSEIHARVRNLRSKDQGRRNTGDQTKVNVSYSHSQTARQNCLDVEVFFNVATAPSLSGAQVYCGCQPEPTSV